MMILPPADVPVEEPRNIGPATPRGESDADYHVDEVLFVGIVEHLQLPVPVRQLPRHLQRRLEIFFKFALPVPPCNSCGDTSGVRFRYFNNANKSSLLQPRYQCCCSTTAANPKSASTLFTLNQKKYAAHLQLHGGIHTILQNNRIILNNCENACQGTTSKLLPLPRHKTSPPTWRAPAFLPARFQSPPATMISSYGGHLYRATTTVLPNTGMCSIGEGAGTFSSEGQELRLQNCTSPTGRAFAAAGGGQQLLYSTGNTSHLNLINQNAVQSSPYHSNFKGDELDKALKVVESGLEEDICIMNAAGLMNDQDLKSIELPSDLELMDLPDLEPMDLPDLAESTNDLRPDLADSMDLPDLADLPDLTESIDLPDISDSMDSPGLDFDRIYFYLMRAASCSPLEKQACSLDWGPRLIPACIK